MSILPSQKLGTTSSSSPLQVPSQDPNSDHGPCIPHQQLLPSPPSPTWIALDSLRISNPESSDKFYGPMPSANEDFHRSSKTVKDPEKQKGKASLAQQNYGTSSQREAAGQPGFVSAQHRNISGETYVSPRCQRSSRSTNCTGNSVGRKNQMVNGNHLLNFHYNPVSRPQPRPSPRRHKKIKPYNKDLFLQANYNFVVLDSGNYASESMNPDKMLLWEDIICVKYSTPSLVNCPICLEDPLCPQITSCGHIFCFPCILQYLLGGEDDSKAEFRKKCPLCFMVISSKDLYTIYLENVKQHCVGDIIDLMLLTRQKDSFTLSMKNKISEDGFEEVLDSFSKFTITSEVDLSVRKAIHELDSWLVRADSGLVDDLEKLPYVCAAMEQLEQRKKYWNERQAFPGNKNNRNDDRLRSHGSSNVTHDCVRASVVTATPPANVHGKSDWLGNSNLDHMKGKSGYDQDVAAFESFENPDEMLSFSAHKGNKIKQGQTDVSRDKTDGDSYNFYQAVDGQHVILHPFNMKCLLFHYGSYDRLPHRISGKILQLETMTQSEAVRRRYRFLSHFSLTTTFQLCEIDLCEILSPESLSPFMDEIRDREKRRIRSARKELKEKFKADDVGTDYVTLPYGFAQSFQDDPPTFSMDDFEALGGSNMTSSSPPNPGEMQLFSSVARLGFAAGHDSPSLSNGQIHTRIDGSHVSSATTGTPSFANIITRGQAKEDKAGSKFNEMGKRGKKSSRILLSTAGGRRY